MTAVIIPAEGPPMRVAPSATSNGSSSAGGGGLAPGRRAPPGRCRRGAPARTVHVAFGAGVADGQRRARRRRRRARVRACSWVASVERPPVDADEPVAGGEHARRPGCPRRTSTIADLGGDRDVDAGGLGHRPPWRSRRRRRSCRAGPRRTPGSARSARRSPPARARGPGRAARAAAEYGVASRRKTVSRAVVPSIGVVSTPSTSISGGISLGRPGAYSTYGSGRRRRRPRPRARG